MNFLTQKHLPRRTVLKGIGAAIALPMPDAMIPARAAPSFATPCCQNHCPSTDPATAR